MKIKTIKLITVTIMIIIIIIIILKTAPKKIWIIIKQLVIIA
jgi:hypothetical protein